ncbi:MAG: recombinase family protein [Balneolaceae bacterium]
MKKADRSPKVVAYLRVSTVDQDTDKFKADILKFANEKEFPGKVEFVAEKVSGLTSWKNRKLSTVMEDLQPGDILIVPELSRLGRSTLDVLEVLNLSTEKEVAVYSVKENFQLNGDDMQSKVMRTMFSLMAEIDSDIRSMRTKEGMQAARKKGVKVGRPKGSGSSKLDQYRDDIINLLKNGSTKTFIAQRYDITPAGLHQWLTKHGLNDIEPEPKVNQ